MKSRFVWFLAFLAIGTSCTSYADDPKPPPSQAPTQAATVQPTPSTDADIETFLTPENIAKLEEDKVIMVSKGSKDANGKSQAQGRALVLVRAPFEPIWDALTQNEHWTEFFPNLVSSEKYMEDGVNVGVHDVIKALFMSFSYHTIQTRLKDKGVIEWRLDKSKKNDIVDTTGSWAIRPHGDKACILIYSASVQSGMNVPKKVEDFFQGQSLRNVVKAVKKRVEDSNH
jgi:hypothetical protein